MMDSTVEESTLWIKPNEVMKKHKIKRQALMARFNTSQPLQILTSPKKNEINTQQEQIKRRNPFRDPVSNCKKRLKAESAECDIIDLFRNKTSSPEKKRVDNTLALLENLRKVDSTSKLNEETIKTLAVDWSLKSRIRFLSTHTLPWKHIFKMSEEASGTTGYVRCLPPENENVNQQDTSSNAKFYQNCLYWQHPNLPAVQLFPRDREKITSAIGIYTNPQIASSLLVEWSNSLRSLYQLLRVRQCPYFYVIASSFTCLYRAAGVGQFPHAHALITPTTLGFRAAMKKEGVDFHMPLVNKKSSNKVEDEDDINLEDVDSFHSTPEETIEYLETLGLDSSYFPDLNSGRSRRDKKKYVTIDGSKLSMVCIEDMELHGLLNFLLNSSTCINSTGPLAGVPPTLLSPVAFNGATLKDLKAYGGQVRKVDGSMYYSMEIRGPILPTTLLSLCDLLRSNIDSFEVTTTSVNSTTGLCSMSASKSAKIPLAFFKEGLVDCGISPELCSILCNLSLPEQNSIAYYNKLEYKNEMFTCIESSAL